MTVARTTVKATVSSPVWANHDRITGTITLTLTYTDQALGGRETISAAREDGTPVGQTFDVNQGLRGGTIPHWDEIPPVFQVNPAEPTITIAPEDWKAALNRLGVTI